MTSKFYRTPILYLIAGAIGLCSLSACNFGGDDTLYIRAIDVVVPADESSVQPLVGLSFEFLDGADIFGDFAGDVVTVSFPSPGTIMLSSGDNSASGSITYGPGDVCTLNIDESTFGADEGPQAGDQFTLEPCSIAIQTPDASQTGVSQSGTVTLNLGGTDSEPVTVTVMVENNGDGTVTIYVNGEPIAVGTITAWGDIQNVTTPAGATGATGTGGTGGTGGVGGGS